MGLKPGFRRKKAASKVTEVDYIGMAKEMSRCACARCVELVIMIIVITGC